MKSQTIFIPIKWEGSLILFLSLIVYNCIAIFSIFNWITFFYERRMSNKFGVLKRVPMTFVDLGVLVLLIIEILAFKYCTSVILVFIGVYGLIDILCTTLRDIILSPAIHKDEDGSYIKIRNSRRWLLLAFINVFQVLLCFAIIIFYLGCDYFDSNCIIISRVTAFYYSTVTFTTLGYGDIFPTKDLSKFLATCELMFFILIGLTKIPIAIALYRVKEEK